MSMDHHQARPGDHLLNKYLPNSDEATREKAREAFRQYALLLIRIGTNIKARMQRENAAASFTDEGGGVKIANI